jgi:hypothetical protein
VTSTNFVYEGKLCRLEDDNNGRMRVVTATGGRTTTTIKEIGTVDYESGLIKLSNFNVSSYTGAAIKIFVLPETNDVNFTRSDYFEIKAEDVNIEVIGIRNS